MHTEEAARMVNEITALNFFNLWKEILLSRKELALKNMRHPTEFTSFVLSDENCIITEIATRLGLYCYTDYYAIDAIFYADEDRTIGVVQNITSVQNIKIAFEHENVWDWKLYNEVAHLLITHSDLKVLVSYPNDDYEPVFNYLSEIVKQSKHSKSISDNENFLLILGSKADFEWSGYIYKNGKWRQL